MLRGWMEVRGSEPGGRGGATGGAARRGRGRGVGEQHRPATEQARVSEGARRGEDGGGERRTVGLVGKNGSAILQIRSCVI
jgi:hypothetical protein